MVKLKSATLLETLIATVLILIVFLVSGLIINNLAKNTIENNTHNIKVKLNSLGYFAKHNKIELPHRTDFNDWNIEVKKNNLTNKIQIEAWHKSNKKTLNKTVYVLE